MRATMAVAAAALLAFSTLAALAKEPPPNGAKKLSELVALVEQRADFAYIADVEWSDKGYDVTYFTKDGAKVEIKYDPVTATPMNLQ